MDSAFIASDETYERVFNPAVLAAWDLADSNGDGVVGFDEFSAFQRAFGTAPADARAAFDAIDTNGDGVLSTDEISVYARQFYVGADENAVGNLFYGPLAAAS
jgi:Ca2+-binding EF-hand superfamily protein